METAKRWPVKACETQTNLVYINSPNLSQIRDFRLSTLLWTNARCLQSGSLNSEKTAKKKWKADAILLEHADVSNAVWLKS